MNRVYISPSTQQNNISVSPAYGTEERVMHLIADEVCDMLKECSIEYFKGKKEQTMPQMVAESDNLAVDAHIAIHSNAMGVEQSGKARGCEALIYKGSIKGRQLAEAIYKQLEPLTPTADRGIKETNTLYEVRETKAPAVIVEVAFHDNMQDAEWILANIRSIAEAIAKGICTYLGVQFKVNPYKAFAREVKKLIEVYDV